MRILIFHEFFQKEADRCNAAIMWADKVFRAGVRPSWMTHHCALLQILQRPGEASFTNSLVARLNIGKPIMLASDASSWFAYEQFYIQFSRINRVGRSKKMVTPFLRLHELASGLAQPEFSLLVPMGPWLFKAYLLKSPLASQATLWRKT